MELEYKFSLNAPAETFLRPLTEALTKAGAEAGVSETFEMRSTYYDTPEKTLRKVGITLRLRFENGNGVVTVKKNISKSGGFSERHEWETPAEDIFSGIPALRTDAETEAALSRAAPHLEICAKVSFTRVSLGVNVFGCEAELALDSGKFQNGVRFDELELEFKSGDREGLGRLAKYIKNTLGLEAEKKSKLRRALENGLAEE